MARVGLWKKKEVVFGLDGAHDVYPVNFFRTSVRKPVCLVACDDRICHHGVVCVILL